MRYAYIKNGNAVEQVRRILRGGEDPSGPDAFIGDFLRTHSAEPLLVLSRSVCRERVVEGALTAEGFPAGRGPAALPARWLSVLRVGLSLLRWRPRRIVCGCTGEMLWVSVLSAKLLRIPIVCSRHSGLASRKGVGWLISALDAGCIRACDAVVCHGPFLAHQVREIGVPDWKIREFDVDLGGFAAGSTEQSVRLFEPGMSIVMYVGRLQANKGVFDLLEAFDDSCQGSQRPVGLVYIGTGRDEAALKAAIERRNLSTRVRLIGAVPHARLPELMRQATVIVAPTQPQLVEGRCMVVLESMVLGVPVIAPNCAAFPYAIRDNVDGMLYEAGKIEALAASLRRMLTDRELGERLRAGAQATGRSLLVSPVGFASAVASAFQADAPRNG